MEKALDNFRDHRDHRDHRDFVNRCIQDRPVSEFLRLDVGDPGGVRKFAEFLGKEPPQDSFPQLNATSDLRSKGIGMGSVIGR